MYFADMWLFWVFLGLGAAWIGARVILALVARRRGEQRTAAVRFSSITRLKKLLPAGTPALRRAVQSLRIITIALLALAMARPQTGRKQTLVSSEGVDIVLAVDTSGSMQALDLDADRARIADRRNRLEVVKSVVERFVEKRETDQIGMVVFGTEAYTQCPLTLDHGIVATFLEEVEIGMAGDATAIGNAIGIATKRLEDSVAKSKVIVLLTDGRQTAGSLSPTKAAEIAKTFGIKIYTIGAGTRGKAPFLVDTLFGKQIQMQQVPIDEKTLHRVAEITGGEYFRAEDEDGLRKIYDKIDALETTEIEMKTFMEYDERFSLFVMPALALLLCELLLLGTRLRKLP